MAAATNFEVPAEVGDLILQKTLDSSGLINLTNVEYISDNRNRVDYDLSLNDAKFHNPTSTDKTVDPDGISTVSVDLYDLYIIKTIPDYTLDAASSVIDALKTSIPLKLAETLQKSVFGSAAIASSPFTGFGTATAVDTTDPDELSALSDSVDGVPTGWLINRQAKADLNKAYNSGANSNSLRDGVADGDLVAGVPAYFTSLTPAPTVLAGVVGDWSQSVLVIDRNMTFNVVDSSTSYAMMLGDTAAIKAKIRVGFAVANPNAFKAFKTLDAGA